MNKKETLEIRKQFSNENCAITRICGCYVDAEKQIRTQLKEAFLSLPEEEIFKYYEIFRKTLSGTIGKNLLNMEFPLAQEMPDGTQAWLLKLLRSRLTDDTLLEQFYEKIIQSYAYGENYYIILIHAAYDIPKKAEDGMEMFDASDDTYEYLMCSICPVKLSKAGLCAMMPRKTPSLTVSATGSSKHRMQVFSFLLLMTAIRTYIACFITPAIRKCCSRL